MKNTQEYLQEENKVFIRGRVSEEDDAPSKLICEIGQFHLSQTRKGTVAPICRQRCISCTGTDAL